MIESGKEITTVRVTNGIEPEDIMTTIDKIDYQITKEKIFDRPIYAQAIRELTPTKPEKKAETENPKKIHKELLKNNEDTKNPKSKEKGKSHKPK